MTGGPASAVHVVGKLGDDGAWHVLLMVPFAGTVLERTLAPDQAESLARQLLEYAALVRDRIGLPDGKVMP